MYLPFKIGLLQTLLHPSAQQISGELQSLSASHSARHPEVLLLFEASGQYPDLAEN